ncbi:MAG: hypothetical protein KBT05_02215 [Bacteroidales bacterium]|nr:hypothetical protein [Candidatus Cryptobacteroides caccocaballi]
MLNRRILRIKAFKALYSSVILRESGADTSISDAEKLLAESCESTRNLYVLMLGLVPALTAVAGTKKIPDAKFVGNALAKLIDEDIDFQKTWKKYKYSWDQYDLILKKIYASICEKKYYADYLSREESSLAEDCRLFTRIYEEEIVDAEGLDEILESMDINWNDDLAYCLTWCCRTFKAFADGEHWRQLPLYQSDILAKEGKAVESDHAFVLKLLQTSYAAYPKYSAMISESVPSFDRDRLVTTDVCLMVCCLCEICNFPSIPVRVSLNEYVEISKFYGTPKSSVFVNGILDRLVVKLRSEGLINKD